MKGQPPFSPPRGLSVVNGAAPAWHLACLEELSGWTVTAGRSCKGWRFSESPSSRSQVIMQSLCFCVEKHTEVSACPLVCGEKPESRPPATPKALPPIRQGNAWPLVPLARPTGQGLGGTRAAARASHAGDHPRDSTSDSGELCLWSGPSPAAGEGGWQPPSVAKEPDREKGINSMSEKMRHPCLPH